MKKQPKIVLPKWPFYIGDILLVLLVLGIVVQARGNLDDWEVFWCIMGITFGSITFITPFILEYKGSLKLTAIAAKAAERENEIARLERILDEMSTINETVNQQVTKHERTVLVFESLVKRMEARLHQEGNEHTVVEFEPEQDVLEGEENMADDNVELELELEEDTYQEPEAGNSATVVARAEMGIGSKLFIRGEGGGLSWESGIPMEFIETGTWQWISKKTEAPIQYRIYKNDEVEAEGNTLIIEPGETQETQPRF